MLDVPTPSASKRKRLAEREAKKNAGVASMDFLAIAPSRAAQIHGYTPHQRERARQQERQGMFRSKHISPPLTPRSPPSYNLKQSAISRSLHTLSSTFVRGETTCPEKNSYLPLHQASCIKLKARPLDETTYHLDLTVVIWLQACLYTYSHILVNTSHAQDFTDSVCTNIMDLTNKKSLIYHAGNHSTYVKTRAENEVSQMRPTTNNKRTISKKCVVR